MASSSISLDKHVFLITLRLMIAASSPMRKLLLEKSKVEIFNALEGGSNLTLHCKSKNDDLGFHTLQSGQSYHFEFRPNFIIDNTLFFCSFAWPEDPTLHYFDIYNGKYNDCVYCPWQVHKQNICGPRHQVPNDQTDCFPYDQSLEKF
ncbi:hypothetical protein L6164_001546 [Bauhinia variegata]|uniref:Uncharacterized protein n=1 Tax=Bauhinia variegata TaxID=167791 RepID=A0ACB9Q9U9_BAUVA|nr:hypothetical protein L6164_001546 [Bauhinia variegata]